MLGRGIGSGAVIWGAVICDGVRDNRYVGAYSIGMCYTNHDKLQFGQNNIFYIVAVRTAGMGIMAKNNKNIRNKYCLFHHELLTLQRRMRRLRNLATTQVDPQISLVLPTLACQPLFNFRELAAYLHMDQGNFSRLAKKMAESNYIEIETSLDDRRQKSIVFTKNGKLALSAAIASWQHNAEVGLASLNLQERNQLGDYFARISDGLGASRVLQLPGEELFVREQKRISQATGMLGNNYLQSSLDIYSYQLLYNVYFRSCAPLSRPSMDTSQLTGIKFGELASFFPTNPSSVSRLVEQYVKKGYLKRTNSKTDRRSVYLTMTNSGNSFFQNKHHNATDLLIHAMRELSANEIAVLINLLQRGNSVDISLEQKPNERALIPTALVTIKRCGSPDDFFRARAFYVEQLVKTNLHYNLPELLIPESDICYLAFHQTEVIAVATFQHIAPNQQPQLSLFISSDGVNASELIYSITQSAFPNKHKPKNSS